MVVHYGGKPCYEILFSRGFSGLADKLRELGFAGRRIAVITESRVSPLYLEAVLGELSACGGELVSHCFPAGEENKHLDTVAEIYGFLIGHRFDRHDLLVALGGGVTGDITGFAAASYLRGVSFVQLPTTLLAQCDSSIGGKTGVDYRGYKNMVGAFHMPRLVWMNLETLRTLEERQFLSGFAEVIKHGFIRDLSYLCWLEEHRGGILERDVEVLLPMIEKSCDIKRQVVEEDPQERGLRQILNFGHTVGHAIEKYLDFTRTHGECVSLGMRAAAAVSRAMGSITEAEEARLTEDLSSFGLPVRWEHTEEDVAAILGLVRSDKKADGDAVRFIGLDSLGSASVRRVRPEALRTGLEALL